MNKSHQNPYANIAMDEAIEQLSHVDWRGKKRKQIALEILETCINYGVVDIRKIKTVASTVWVNNETIASGISIPYWAKAYDGS